LINAGGNPADQPQPKPQPTEADLARADAGAAGDTEDKIAAKIGEEHASSKLAGAVSDAIDKYDISEDLANDIYRIAQEEGIEPAIAFGLVKTESSFKNTAVSHVGARGLTQVMPRTARWMVPGTKPSDLHDQKTNLRLGFKYLNQMIDKYDGNVRLALLAYNRGPGTVDKILRKGGDPNNGYADKVLRG
jgi:soluble lytic murein transglycosylase-like protein